MKNVRIKTIAGIACLASIGTIYSFAKSTNNDDSGMKRYEVVRMHDGEMVNYDTVVAANSTFTPQDYLAFLGFESEENVQIIDLLNVPTGPEFIEEGGEGERMVIIEIDEDTDISGEGGEDVIINKRVMKMDDGDGEEIEIEISSDGPEFNIDSLIAIEKAKHPDGDVVIQKVMITEDINEGGEQRKWHDINEEGADYHKEINEPGKHVEVAIWGAEEDFTLIIISDPATNPKAEANKVKVGNKSVPGLELYPNPAENTTQIKLFFEEEANTVLSVTDMNGRTIEQVDLGLMKGKYFHIFKVSEWQSGVYLVQVEHGDQVIIEKLIVQ